MVDGAQHRYGLAADATGRHGAFRRAILGLYADLPLTPQDCNKQNAHGPFFKNMTMQTGGRHIGRSLA
jgi:hypothetical protein